MIVEALKYFLTNGRSCSYFGLTLDSRNEVFVIECFHVLTPCYISHKSSTRIVEVIVMDEVFLKLFRVVIISNAYPFINLLVDCMYIILLDASLSSSVESHISSEVSRFMLFRSKICSLFLVSSARRSWFFMNSSRVFLVSLWIWYWDIHSSFSSWSTFAHSKMTTIAGSISSIWWAAPLFSSSDLFSSSGVFRFMLPPYSLFLAISSGSKTSWCAKVLSWWSDWVRTDPTQDMRSWHPRGVVW